MIVVIADDLTGAAEIGGLGLNYGLTTEITTNTHSGADVDLLVISTDSRSMPENEALAITHAACDYVARIKPDILFKKVDSVLRGHVIAEIKLQMGFFGCKKALLIPANPRFGRTLTGGKYYVNEQLIHKTSFAHDPEFAIGGSRPHEMLRVSENYVAVHNIDDKLPSSGIIIGESAVHDDLVSWIGKTDKDTLMAGGAGLFTALLESLGLEKITVHNEIPLNSPALIVCGSTHDKSRYNVKKLKDYGGPVSYMPRDIIIHPTDGGFEMWADEIISLIKKNKKVIIAIDETTTTGENIAAKYLRENKAIVVEKVFQKIKIKELIVEGGSTAAAIINRLNFDRFLPVEQPGTGVIKMKVIGNDAFLMLKPGSYDWPAKVWDF